MKSLWIIPFLCSIALAQGGGGKVGFGGKAGFGGGAVAGGASVSIRSHSYIPNPACTSGGLTCPFTFTITNTGDTAHFSFGLCTNASCTAVAPTTLTAADTCGNTWTNVANANTTASNTWRIYNFVAANATSGTCTVTVTETGSVQVYYAMVEEVEYAGANTTTPVDSSVSTGATNTAAGSVSLVSAGNVSATGEVVMVQTRCTGSTPSNTGTYTTLDSNGTDTTLSLDTLNPTSGSTTTASWTCSAGNYYATMISFKP